MKAIKFSVTIAVIAIMILGCSKQVETIVQNDTAPQTEVVSKNTTETVTPEVKTIAEAITPEEALLLLDDQSIVLIDVRTPEEFQTGHIKDSINIPLDLIKDEINNQVPELSQTIVVYCRSGNRSGQASIILQEMGYKTIYDLGGIIDWPYDIVTE